MRLFPMYRALSMDYLFFYTINFLFMTQVKGLSAAEAVIEDSFYGVFILIFQFPAAIIVDNFGRKKSMVLGSILNIIYMTIFILGPNLGWLIFAEMFASFAFALKDVADLSLLNESIPETKSKSEIFAKIDGKSYSNYYILNSISLLASGFLFEVNGYLPLIISIVILVIAFILSTIFVEPLPKEVNMNHNVAEQFKDSIINFKDSFKFLAKSKRIRALLFFASIMNAFICLMVTYQVDVFEESGATPILIGALFAIAELIAGILSKKHDSFHEKFTNRTLTVIAITVVLFCLILGLSGITIKSIPILLLLLTVMLVIKYTICTIYQILMDKYLRNFTNEEIDTKIFAVKTFFNSLASVAIGFLGAALLDNMNIYYAFLTMSAIFGVSFLISLLYMKTRVGLKVEEYPEEEIFTTIEKENENGKH